MSGAGSLDGLRVVEFGGAEVAYAGKLFADQGADVLLVERAGGHPMRRIGPFAPGSHDDVASTSFTYLHGAKRSVELPPDVPAAREVLGRLVEGADVVLLGGRPADLEAAGLDVGGLSAARLVVTVTPFGWAGPWRDEPADEFTLNALGGLMSLGGYADGRPLQPPSGLSSAISGVFAAVGAMSHLLGAVARPGHVDVSVQECVVMALENAAQFWDLEKVVRRRSGGADSQVGRGVYACADGWVYLMLGLSAGSAFWTRFQTWLEEWEVPGREELSGPRWLERSFIESEPARAAFRAIVEPMFAARSKDELYAAARRFGIPLAPVNRVGDLFNDEQLRHRGFFVEVDHASWPHGPARAPGPGYRLSASPASARYAPPRRQGAPR